MPSESYFKHLFSVLAILTPESRAPFANLVIDIFNRDKKLSFKFVHDVFLFLFDFRVRVI